MKNSILYSRVLIIFFLVIFVVPGYWLLRDNDLSSWSLIEYRYLNPFPPFPVQDFRTGAKRVLQRRPVEAWKIIGTKFESGLFPKQLETAGSDQFPMRSLWIQASYGFDRLMIRLGYMFEDDTVLPTDMRASGIYETRHGLSTLFYFPGRIRESDIKRIDNAITNYETLIDAHPDINFYAFHIETLEYSKANPLNPYRPEPVQGHYLEYFLTRAPEDLDQGMLVFTSFDDYFKYFYRTDHHWNIHGTLRAYEIIHQMLAINYPEISTILPHDQIYAFPDVGFNGRLARFAVYQVQPPDTFEVAMVDLPPFRILDKNGNDFKLNKMYEYLAGEYSKKPFTDHYIEYYGADDDFHEFVSENGSDRNLLIIGDSYVNSIETLLASHYHHTYSVDIRNYPDDHFSLSEFLLQHDVDDVLFLGGRNQTVTHNWTISP